MTREFRGIYFTPKDSVSAFGGSNPSALAITNSLLRCVLHGAFSYELVTTSISTPRASSYELAFVVSMGGCKLDFRLEFP
jgi:hypothetical protein